MSILKEIPRLRTKKTQSHRGLNWSDYRYQLKWYKPEFQTIYVRSFRFFSPNSARKWRWLPLKAVQFLYSSIRLPYALLKRKLAFPQNNVVYYPMKWRKVFVLHQAWPKMWKYKLVVTKAELLKQFVFSLSEPITIWSDNIHLFHWVKLLCFQGKSASCSRV